MAKHSSKQKDEKEEKFSNEPQADMDATTADDLKTENIENEVETETEVIEVDELTELKTKLAEMNDKYLRLVAEYDNYRRRTLKEKIELSKTAGESLLLKLLPVVDDFDRALVHIDDASDIDAVKDGIKLIYNKFGEFLSQQGLKEIEAKEKEFDTDLHEAITKIPAPVEEMKGKVIDCVEKGYLLHEKVIRFSKVVVGE